MNNIIVKNLTIFLILVGLTKSINADELKPSDSHQFNFFSGVFDINTSSKKSSELFGVQHSNEDLFRDTFLGKLSPITGFMMTADSASYFYTGVQAEYKIGKLNLTPSFSPGLYSMGDGKDLGSPLEFKSELQLSLDLRPGTKLGYSQSHLSNAGLDDKNPGADSYMFNFMKSF
jgi:lipid A 3-O-deacylase